MCRLMTLMAGLCLIIAGVESIGSTGGFCDGKPDGNYANPSDLSSFYSCSNGLTHILNCPEDLIFRQSCNCCDWPKTTTRPGESTGGFCEGKPDGNYANPSDLSSFYSCSNGLTHVLNCPEDLIFRQSCNCCDWPTTRPGGSTGGFCEGKPDGNYANPSDLSSFYSCSNGLTHVLNCPETLIFRQSCNCCDWPKTRPGGSTGGFCEGKPDGNYANPSNLSSFYSCSNGLTHILNCPEDLIFRQSCNCCDWPTTTTRPGESTGGFCEGKPDGNYANPSDLSSFYSCSNGLTHVLNCPEDLIFRQRCNCCDWPTTRPGGSTGGFCEGKPDGNYANPSNLSSFYSCSNGLTHILNCPEDLIFRQSCNCCDWPTTTTRPGESTGGFCEGKPDGNYANPSDLSSFYSCSNGLTHILNCPEDLIFRQSCNCCDWPKTTTRPGESTGGFCEGKPDGNYANPSDLSSFYSCSNGLTHILNCPEDLIFRQSCNCCDWPTTTTRPGESTGGFCEGKPDGNYANPSDLSSFYSCSNGLTHVLNCPETLIFRQSCNCCDWPTTTTRPGESTGGFCDGKPDGNYANPSDLSSFYSCSNGLTHVLNCPEDLIFRQSCNCCDWPTTRPGGSTGGFCEGKPDGNYANPSDLSSFYSCSNGLTHILNCPEDLIFRQSCNCCDWPKTTTRPGESTGGFCEGKPDGNYANPSDLSSFYSCSNGLTYILNCPEDLIFRQSCNCCDWPKATTRPGESTGGFCEGKPDGNYANPSDLSSFYSCSNGLTHVLNCPETLIFRQSCNCCDWPTTRPGGSTGGFCEGKPDGNYANPSDLSSFYSCSNGLTHILNCPEDLIFRQSCNCCDWPKTTTRPGESTGGFCEGKPDGNYANPSDLSSFYSCSNGLTHVLNCPEDLIFRQSCNCCDWPTTRPGGSTGGFCEGKPDGNYANPSDLSSFYSCSNGLTHVLNCPETLIFRQSCNCCDWPTTRPGGSTGGFCEGKPDGNYANPSDLSSFYSCSNGLTHILNCPEDLIFRQSCNCCDWPTTTTRPGESTGGFCEGKPDGNYANPSDLSSFYSCSNGLTHVLNCPEDLIFRQSCNCCDWPTTRPGGSTGGFCEGKPDGNYANPSDLSSFYSCSNGLTHVLNCPEDLIFRQSCNCCDWPTTTTRPGGSTGGFCEGKPDGNYANPSDLSSFYSCSNGLTHVLNCPEDLIFRQSCNCCDWPTTRPGESTGGFCEGKPDGNYANPSDLSSFYSCSNGLTHVLNCPEDLIFRQSCNCCDWPTTRPGGSTGGFCEGKPDGNYANPSDLSSFYSCSNGLTHILNCPEDLIFRQSCNCCDWPKTTTRPGESTGGFCEGKPDGNYANPSDLSSFYSCSNGLTHVLNCPEDLIFRQSCNCCDWPTTRPGGSTGGFCEGKPDGNYANPSNLSSFYSCSNGLTHILNCPEDLIFRQSCNCCDWT